MDATKVQCLKWGTSMMDALLESKILDLFEKTKGDFNAHGMGVSCGDVPILGLYPQPQALRTNFYPS
jgi:hypothetical protein